MWLDPAIALTSAGVLGVGACLMWGVSLAKRDASIADVAWGLGFVVVALVAYRLGHGAPERQALVLGLTCLWGLRLAGYIAWRNHGRGEDARYRAMREQHGARWGLLSLFKVFLLQAALIWLISLPVQVALSLSASAGLNWLDGVGAAVVLVGVMFEAVGDFQLLRFKADPANRGQVMTSGLWRYTRHPNYFGDFCVWWGLFMIAAATGVGAWTIVSPLVMSFLLLRVSGVPMLEAAMAGRPGYADYVRRTSAFFPRPPRQDGP